MSGVSRKTPRLDKAAEMMRALNGQWRVVPRCSEASAAKLGWLAKRGRNFMEANRALELGVTRFVRAELSFEPSASARKLLAAGAEGARAHVLLRFAGQGNDVRLRPLTVAYLARKIAKGLDPRIGIATRALVTDLGSCPWIIER